MVLIWCIVGIAAFALECVTAGNLISIWLCAGAIAAAVVAACQVELWIQVVVFLVVSLLTVLVIRPVAVKYLRGNVIATNTDRLIGKTGFVTQEITAGHWGEVKVDGTAWSAVEVDGNAVAVGETVRIAAIEGAKLIVRKRM